MKFKGPEHITSVSVGGECFNVGDDGLIETPDNGEYASLVAPHGFMPHAVAEKAKTETAAEKKAREKAEKAAAANDSKTETAAEKSE